MGIFGIILNFFTGPLGKIAGYVIAGLVVIAILFGVYHSIRKSAMTEQLLLDQKAQLERVVQQQQEFIELTNKLSEQSRQAIEDYNKKLEEIKGQTNSLYDFLDDAARNNKLGANKESSDILKETLRKLKENK